MICDGHSAPISRGSGSRRISPNALVNHVSYRSDVEEVYDHYRHLPEMCEAMRIWEAHVASVIATPLSISGAGEGCLMVPWKGSPSRQGIELCIAEMCWHDDHRDRVDPGRPRQIRYQGPRTFTRGAGR
jgi:hypothetical protein